MTTSQIQPGITLTKKGKTGIPTYYRVLRVKHEDEQDDIAMLKGKWGKFPCSVGDIKRSGYEIVND